MHNVKATSADDLTSKTKMSVIVGPDGYLIMTGYTATKVVIS